MAEICYKCGSIRHGKTSCSSLIDPINSYDRELYGPWLLAKADIFTVIREGHYLRRMEIPKGEIFDFLQEDLN